MSKFQVKAPKVVTEFLNEKKRKKHEKLFREFQEMAKKAGNETAEITDSPYTCYYCQKAFFTPKYVIKHILRRHPDKLLNLHDKLNSREKVQNKISMQKTVPKTVASTPEHEINELGVILEKLKLEVLQLLQMVVQLRDTGKLQSSNASDIEETKPKTRRQRKKDISEPSHISELVELREKCKNSEEAIQNLEKRLVQLQENVIQDMSLKETKRKNDDQRLIEELNIYTADVSVLKNSLEHKMNSLKSSIFHEMQKQNLEWEEKFSNFNDRHTLEVHNLCSLFENQLSKLHSAENNDVEERFEHHLQQYLNKLPHKSGKIKERRPASNYASVTTNPKTLDTRFNKFSKEVNSLKRVKAAQMQNPNFLENLHTELEKLVDIKLHNFGLSSGKNRITSLDLAVKSKLAKNEERSLQSKYANFQVIRKNLEKVADREVQSRIVQGVRGRKITFALSDSVVLPSSLRKKFGQSNNPASPNRTKDAKVQNSFEFVVSSFEDESDTLFDTEQTRDAGNSVQDFKQRKYKTKDTGNSVQDFAQRNIKMKDAGTSIQDLVQEINKAKDVRNSVQDLEHKKNSTNISDDDDKEDQVKEIFIKESDVEYLLESDGYAKYADIITSLTNTNEVKNNSNPLFRNSDKASDQSTSNTHKEGDLSSKNPLFVRRELNYGDKEQYIRQSKKLIVDNSLPADSISNSSKKSSSVSSLQTDDALDSDELSDDELKN